MKVIYLPIDINIEKLVIENPPSFKYHIEDFKFLIGTIIRIRIEIKKYLDEGSTEYIPLHSQILQRRIRNYNHCFNYLIEHGVIDKDYYIPNKKSTGYKLSEIYSSQGFKKDQITLRRLIRKRTSEFIREQALKRKYRHLTKWFNPSLQIDFDGANAYLKSLLDKELEIGVKNPIVNYHYRLASVDRISNQIFSLSVDETSFRFHSNLTNLKSSLRKFITYDGQLLCSVDIKNSQPFISMILLNPDFYLKNEGSFNLFSLSKTLYFSLSNIISSILSIISSISTTIMLVKSHESQASNEFELYCTLVDKGRLYQFLNTKYFESTGIKYDLNIPNEKGLFKKMFFHGLYADNRMKPDDENLPLRNVFKKQFPNVYKIFALIKRQDKSTLPIILQTIESEIVINRTTRRFAKDYPNVPIFTIHDSIVTLDSYKYNIEALIKMEFETAFGLQPSLDPQAWAF